MTIPHILTFGWIDIMAQRPLIGITLDSEQPGGYSKFPWYALRQNYATAVANHGGLPLGLAHDNDLVDHYLDLIDGLIVTGGAFDVDPALYGATERHQTVAVKSGRTRFEWAIVERAHDRDMPILGICGGQQLLNVVLGGTLIQHIPDSVAECLAHEQPNPRDEAGHDILVEPQSFLHRITQQSTLAVNSAHHQAVAKPAPCVAVSATASDGVIEAIEDPSRTFCLGVQWHPEFEIDAGDSRIIKAFIDASAGR